MPKTVEQRLQDLAARLEPAIRDAFIAAIRKIQDNVILTDLIAAIEANDFERAYRLLSISNASLVPIVTTLETTFGAGGDLVGSSFPSRLSIPNYGRVRFTFDVRNPSAERYLKEQSGRLITRIQEDTRVNVRNAMQIGLEKGANPRQTALDIVGRVDQTGKRMGGLVGLTQQQELWVRNAKRDLENLDAQYFTRTARDKRFDSVVRKAIESGKPLDKATIDRLITRYKDSLLRLRGETIARTETIQALNRSQLEAYNQAVEMGAIARKDIFKEWDSAGDARVRDSHRHMDGQRVQIDEPFKTPDGHKLMFPGDGSLGAPAEEIINCRCRIKLKADWLADLD